MLCVGLAWEATGVAFAAEAQQRPPRFELPGELPFGMSYAEAKQVLGRNGDEVVELAPNEYMYSKRTHTMTFSGKSIQKDFSYQFKADRLVTVILPLSVIEGASATGCVDNDALFLPDLVQRYGEPDSRRSTGDEQTITFAFSDGTAIEYSALHDVDEDSCNLALSYNASRTAE